MTWLRRLLSGCLGVCLLLPAPLRYRSTSALAPEAHHVIDALDPGQTVRVIVHLADRPALDLPGRQDQIGLERPGQIAARLRAHADASQASLREWLRQREAAGQAQDVTPFWSFNGLAVTASREVVRELAQRPDVERIALDDSLLAPNRARPAGAPAPVADNLIAIGAPSAWARGVTGQGVVVALLDSGVDMSHLDLAARWRGGTNSWLDPYGEHPDAPFDVNGHGTQTLGVILGGDAGGSAIGVAPGAQWIAARIFDNRDRATIEGIHKALQWVLDPDGDPSTPDAPDVVNNSWSFVNAGCDGEFADDLRALRAAGILPVFAAGVRDSVSPANTPEAFAVGALADAETALADSPRGPSVCGDKPVFPQVVAPGADIRTTDRFGTYAMLDGSSLAAAHVSGALALLLDADPELSAAGQESILTETAVDLGAPGPDSTFGYGRIDVAAALDRVLGPDPSRPSASLTPSAARGDAGASIWIAVGGLLILALTGLAIVRRAAR
jgi:subtilisin family serine protease